MALTDEQLERDQLRHALDRLAAPLIAELLTTVDSMPALPRAMARAAIQRRGLDSMQPFSRGALADVSDEQLHRTFDALIESLLHIDASVAEWCPPADMPELEVELACLVAELRSVPSH